jgi:LssY C-terminus
LTNYFSVSRLVRALAVSWIVAHARGAQSNAFGDAHVRLLTPLSSISSKPGSEFHAVVIAPLNHSGRVLMPQGTIVSGTITSRKSVGLGLVRERATLGIEFREYALPDGSRFPLQARLRHVENGRESVTSDGQIKGVLAADSPQAIVGGIWTRPTWTLLQRSTVGLTGASGRVWTSYSLGPFGAVGLFALRCTLFGMPEPDIQLPVGAELSVTVLGVPANAPDFEIPEPSPVPPDLEEVLENQPFVIRRPNGRAVKDIINVAFEGTSEDLVNAFSTAGWNLASPLTTRSFTRVYLAFTEQRGYSEAPASTLTYQGEPPVFVFQKSLNSVLLRHHVRIWRVRAQGREIWLGAGTRDIGMGFDARSVKLTHRIQAQIDSERSKIVNDLTFSGCSDPAGFIERPDAVREKFKGSGITTDGRLAVLLLRRCEAVPASTGMDTPTPVGSRVTRLARRMVLETRHYVERENSFFWTYRAIKWGVAARRNRTVVDEED